jgi:hypothetical protein
MAQSKKKTVRQFKEVVKKLDMFGTPLELLTGDDTRKYRTLCGTVTTILSLTLILSYSVYKFVGLQTQIGVSFDTFVIQDYYKFKNDFTFPVGPTGNTNIGFSHIDHTNYTETWRYGSV